MSRSGGYKYYNIRCGSCIGKTLCGEPGDGALECDDRMCKKSATDYKALLSEREGVGDAGGDGMTLYDILRATKYWQKFCCYVTNSYDQNVPIGFGTRRELLDEEQNDELFDYLMCDVDSITVAKDKSLLIRVRDEHYNKPLEEQYECTGGWKVSDPKTRPFKFSNEMEDWEYHG